MMTENILLYLLYVFVAIPLLLPKSRDWIISRLHTIDDYMVEERKAAQPPEPLTRRSPRLEPQPGDKVFYTQRNGTTVRRDVLSLAVINGLNYITWRSSVGVKTEPLSTWSISARDVWFSRFTDI